MCNISEISAAPYAAEFMVKLESLFAYLNYGGVKQGLKMPGCTVVHTDPATPITEDISAVPSDVRQPQPHRLTGITDGSNLPDCLLFSRSGYA